MSTPSFIRNHTHTLPPCPLQVSLGSTSQPPPRTPSDFLSAPHPSHALWYGTSASIPEVSSPSSGPASPSFSWPPQPQNTQNPILSPPETFFAFKSKPHSPWSPPTAHSPHCPSGPRRCWLSALNGTPQASSAVPGRGGQVRPPLGRDCLTPLVCMPATSYTSGSQSVIPGPEVSAPP